MFIFLHLSCFAEHETFIKSRSEFMENILGSPGDGAKIVFSSLNQTRLSAAAGAVGVAQACLETAVKYCNERKPFGKPTDKNALARILRAALPPITLNERLNHGGVFHASLL